MNPVTTPPAIPARQTHGIDRQEAAQSQQEVTVNQIPKAGTVFVEGKHIAKRAVSEWPNYGDPKEWDAEFEKTVVEAVDLIQAGNLGPVDLISHFEKKRHEIAVKRKNKQSMQFGLRRDDLSEKAKKCTDGAQLCLTPLAFDTSYGYALERALMIPYDAEHYIEAQSDVGKIFSEYYPCPEVLKYGLVQGKKEGENIPLTQYIFAPQIRNHKAGVVFGPYHRAYISTSDGPKSAIWLHPSWEIIPECLKYINEMVKKCINGDLSFIPKIHWWYVHLAPTWRGSGGIAEMLTNTLCRIHGVDLPPWKERVAPSVEILLEPDEEKFSLNYHQLFEKNQEELKELFKAQDKMSL